jgi:hypothetical protein
MSTFLLGAFINGAKIAPTDGQPLSNELFEESAGFCEGAIESRLLPDNGSWQTVNQT